jgi:hypothetical protein
MTMHIAKATSFRSFQSQTERDKAKKKCMEIVLNENKRKESPNTTATAAIPRVYTALPTSSPSKLC